MADEKMNSGLDLGRGRKRSGRISTFEVIAFGVSGLWLGACVLFFAVLGLDMDGQGAAGFIMTLLAVFLPVAVIWLAASAARSANVMRAETQRLQSTIDALRQSVLTSKAGDITVHDPALDAKIAQLEAAQKQTEETLTTFSSRRTPPPALPPETPVEEVTPNEADQSSLALEPQPQDDADPLSTDELIRAMHFPENADDAEGFAALRRGLKDRCAARLLQAAQDVLTLLSQDGIYMDDLRPERARPEIWRSFAQGQRGREVAALGGIRDRSSLVLTAGRMKSDPIFRDAAHHFLRRFDEVIVSFEQTASDADIARMAETRSARAFMLLGRVTGTFT